MAHNFGISNPTVVQNDFEKEMKDFMKDEIKKLINK